MRNSDLVLDFIGGETYERSLDVVRPSGTVVTIAAISANDEKVQVRGIHALNASGLNSNRAELVELMRLIGAGVVKPTISHVYSLDEVQAALTAISGGHTRGKTVVAIP